jgi:hypothetical protein
MSEAEPLKDEAAVQDLESNANCWSILVFNYGLYAHTH